ncbi:heavy-metal-associated domain-containing protein [Neisseriaceae bacterium B1]
METITLKIDGMTCGGCVNSVTRVLSETAGVANAQVDLQSGTAVVQFDAAQTNAAALVGVVEEAGFDAAEV